MGIYATGQTYEQLVLHLLASPLNEARDYGKMILHELQQVIPSFVARVDRPDRGGRWSEFLRAREQTARSAASRLEIQGARTDAPSVRLLRTSGTEQELAAALLFEATGASETETLAKVDQLDSDQLTALLTELVGDRDNRRHRPRLTPGSTHPIARASIRVRRLRSTRPAAPAQAVPSLSARCS